MKTTDTARAAYIPTSRATRVRIGNFKSVARRYAVLDALVARVNTDLITTAQYLADVLHADADFVRRFAGSFGKVVKATFVAEYGTGPQRSGIARVGTKLFPAFAYRVKHLTVLAKAAATYPRTAQLLAA